MANVPNQPVVHVPREGALLSNKTPDRGDAFKKTIEDFFYHHSGFEMKDFLEFNKRDWDVIFTDKSWPTVPGGAGNDWDPPDSATMTTNEFYTFMGNAVFDKSANKYLSAIGIDHLSDEALTDIFKELIRRTHIKVGLLSKEGFHKYARYDLQYRDDIPSMEADVLLAMLGYLDMKINEKARGCGTYMCYKILEPIFVVGLPKDLTNPIKAKSPAERLRHLITAHPDRLVDVLGPMDEVKEVISERPLVTRVTSCTYWLNFTDGTRKDFPGVPALSRDHDRAVKDLKNALYEKAFAFLESKGYKYDELRHEKAKMRAQMPETPGTTMDGYGRSSPNHLKLIRAHVVKMLSLEPANVQSRELVSLLLSPASLDSFAMAFTTRAADPINNYETFEFMGDSVVNRAVYSYLFVNMKKLHHPDFIPIFTTLDNRLKGKIILSELSCEYGFDKLVVKVPYEDRRQNVVPHEYKTNNPAPKRPRWLENTEEDIFEDVLEAFFGVLEKTVDTCLQDGAGYLVCENIIWRMLDAYDLGVRGGISIQYHHATDPKALLRNFAKANEAYFEPVSADYGNGGIPVGPEDWLFIWYKCNRRTRRKIWPEAADAADVKDFPKWLGDELARRALLKLTEEMEVMEYKFWRDYPRIVYYPPKADIFDVAISKLGRDTVKPRVPRLQKGNKTRKCHQAPFIASP